MSLFGSRFQVKVVSHRHLKATVPRPSRVDNSYLITVISWLFVDNTSFLSGSFYNLLFVLDVLKSQFTSVKSLSRVWLFVTPRTAAHQASLSITNSRSSPKENMHLWLFFISPFLSSNLVFPYEGVLIQLWGMFFSYSLDHVLFLDFLVLPKSTCLSRWILLPLDWLSISLSFYLTFSTLMFLAYITGYFLNSSFKSYWIFNFSNCIYNFQEIFLALFFFLLTALSYLMKNIYSSLRVFIRLKTNFFCSISSRVSCGVFCCHSSWFFSFRLFVSSTCLMTPLVQVICMRLAWSVHMADTSFLCGCIACPGRADCELCA